MTRKQKYTKEGFEKLLEELNYLKNVRREEVKAAIAEARGHGDLSENSEYDEARNEQGKVEARIKELEELARNADVIDGAVTDRNTVGIGAKVKIQIDNRDPVEYHIVGSNEADPLNGKISDQSPIGKHLIGAKAGSTVVVHTPSGTMNIKVLSVNWQD